MKKIIALSAFLVLSALGMACGGETNTNGNKPAANNTNSSTPVAVNTATPVSAPNSNANAPKANTPAPNANARRATPAAVAAAGSVPAKARG